MDDQNKNNQPSDQATSSGPFPPTLPVAPSLPIEDITPVTDIPITPPTPEPVVPPQVETPSFTSSYSAPTPTSEPVTFPPIPEPTYVPPQAVPTNSTTPEVTTAPISTPDQPAMPEIKTKKKISPIVGGLVALLFVAGVAGAAFYVSNQLSTRQAVAPNAPESEPRANAIICGTQTCNSSTEVCCCMGCFPKEEGCSTHGCDGGSGTCDSTKRDAPASKTITFTKTGKVIPFISGGYIGNITLTKTGSTPINISFNGQDPGELTSFNVTAGDVYTINVRISSETQDAYGWIPNKSTNICGPVKTPGEPLSGSTATGLCGTEVDISPVRTMAVAKTDLTDITAGGVNATIQCWGDAELGDATQDYDYNDFTLVFGYEKATVCVPNGTLECTPDCSTICGTPASTIDCKDSCGKPTTKSCPKIADCETKTWNITTTLVCPSGLTPKNIQMARIIWPRKDKPASGPLDCVNDIASKETTHSMTISSNNPSTDTNGNLSQGYYVYLQTGDPSNPDTTCQKDGTVVAPATISVTPIVPIIYQGNYPTTGDFFFYSKYFDPPTMMLYWNYGRLTQGSYNITYNLPTDLCESTEAETCILIKIYKKVDGVYGTTPLTQAQLNDLKVGDVLRLSWTANFDNLQGRVRATVISGSATPAPGEWLTGTLDATNKKLFTYDGYTVTVTGSYNFEAQVSTTQNSIY